MEKKFAFSSGEAVSSFFEPSEPGLFAGAVSLLWASGLGFKRVRELVSRFVDLTSLGLGSNSKVSQCSN